MLANAFNVSGDPHLPITLPNGRVVKNRLVKVAMYEHLANFFGGPPNQYHYNLYARWARHGWGILVTGNVQVSRKHCTLGRDMVVPDKVTVRTLEPFTRLASCMKLDTTGEPSGTLAIMQLNHGGRQSTNLLGGRLPFEAPLAPSSIRVGSKSNSILSRAIHAILFQTPREMAVEDIDEVVASFVKGAKVALESGFDGIQLHAAHGYLLAQFISPKSNHRADQYSSTPENALRLVHRIVKEIRTIVPSSFIVGIKMNAADYVSYPQSFNEDEDRAVEHMLAMAEWKMIDFIEISGGDYERPDFMSSTEDNALASPRQAFFSQLSHRVVRSLTTLTRDSDDNDQPPLILLTGGLRTPGHLHVALASGDAHLLGIGRGSVLCPDLPELLKVQKENYDIWDMNFAPMPDLSAPSFLSQWPACYVWKYAPKISLIGAGVEMAWYIVTMRYLASDPQAKVRSCYNVGFFGAVFWMWVWVPLLQSSPEMWIVSVILVALSLIIARTSVS